MQDSPRRFIFDFPDYRSFLVAIHSADARIPRQAIERMEKLVGEDDLEEDYLLPLRRGDFRADLYIHQKYAQIADLADKRGQ